MSKIVEMIDKYDDSKDIALELLTSLVLKNLDEKEYKKYEMYSEELKNLDEDLDNKYLKKCKEIYSLVISYDTLLIEKLQKIEEAVTIKIRYKDIENPVCNNNQKNNLFDNESNIKDDLNIKKWWE